METNNKEGKCSSGTCGGTYCCSSCAVGPVEGMGCYGHGHKHKIFKKIFLLIIMIMLFHFGMEIGELKGELRGGYGGVGMMRSYNNDFGYGMMGGWNRNFNTPVTPNTQVAPSAIK